MRATPTWKKLRHTFYLVQPVLQFVLLAFAVTALSRCSPLSPSGDKISAKSLNPLKGSASESIAASVDEDAFQQNLHSLNSTEVQFQTEEEFQQEQKLAQSIFNDVQNFVTSEQIRSATKEFPLVTAKLSGEGLDVLAQGREARIPLAASQDFLVALKKNPGSFNAFAVLVGAPQSQQPRIRLEVQVSVIDSQNAFVRLTHLNGESPEVRAQALHTFAAMARSAKFLAVMLQ